VATAPDAAVSPSIVPPARYAEPDWSREEAVVSLLRGRLEAVGPAEPGELADSLGIARNEADVALLALEAEGGVLRGSFTPGVREPQWCNRRLLARIHRYTLNRLRAEIRPVSAADFIRFLFEWQHVEPEQRMSGAEGLAQIVSQLDGYETAAAGWESDVLSARCEAYGPELLDTLCLTGRVGWGRLSQPAAVEGGSGLALSGPLRSSPISLFSRENLETWLELRHRSADLRLSTHAGLIRDVLSERGALFFHEIVAATGLLPTQVEQALGELVALGVTTADSFSGLRALLTPSDRRPAISATARRRRRARSPYGVEGAGRWSLLERSGPAAGAGDHPTASDAPDATVEVLARTLLRRYGVVFRRLLSRESGVVAWRSLVRTYRRLEDRGELRGGRFVNGFSGEQFALPEAVARLRAVRRQAGSGRLVALSAADPLNLVGVLTPGDLVPALAGNRVVFRDGIPLGALESGAVRRIAEAPDVLDRELERALRLHVVPPALRTYLGRAG
jgi:ATP-dependent Lhr-like helicase